MGQKPNVNVLFSRKAILFLCLILGGLGLILVKRTDYAVEDLRPLPHATAIKSLNVLATALGRYKFHVGEYPSTQEGLNALSQNPNKTGWLGPYIVQMKPDPWNNAYQYSLEDGVPKLATMGPDGKLGTPDDLHPDPDSYNCGTDWTNGWLKVEDRLPDLDKYYGEKDE